MSDYLLLAVSLALIVAVVTGLDKRLGERFSRKGFGKFQRSVPRVEGKGVLVRNVKAVKVGRYVVLTVVLERPANGVVSDIEVSDPIGLSALAIFDDNEVADEVTS